MEQNNIGDPILLRAAMVSYCIIVEIIKELEKHK